MIRRMAMKDWPKGAVLTLAEEPAPGFRAELAHHIHAFHGQTIRYDARRFDLALRDAEGRLLAGIAGLMSWGWLFIEAAWVDAALRGQGVGRRLMERAEAYARDNGCHDAWLDTFQAERFYLALGYERFGALPNYPAGQQRAFLRKRLT
jgi:GNAT superfamily N-acetyltransferase